MIEHHSQSRPERQDTPKVSRAKTGIRALLRLLPPLHPACLVKRLHIDMEKFDHMSQGEKQVKAKLDTDLTAEDLQV